MLVWVMVYSITQMNLGAKLIKQYKAKQSVFFYQQWLYARAQNPVKDFEVSSQLRDA